MKHIFILLVLLYPSFILANISASTFKLLNQVYGNYDSARECWVIPEKVRAEYHYCMKVKKIDLINTEQGKRNYLVLSSNLLNKEGESTGFAAHVDSGRVGLFIIDLRKKRMLAANPLIVMGAWGYSPREWSLLKLGPSDYWGWKTYIYSSHFGHVGSKTIFFAPYGKKIIKEVAAIISSYSDELNDGSTSIDVKIEVDNLEISKRMFPLKVEVTGTLKGKHLKPKTWAIPFDLKNWRYKEPRIWPLFLLEGYL